MGLLLDRGNLLRLNTYKTRIRFSYIVFSILREWFYYTSSSYGSHNSQCYCTAPVWICVSPVINACLYYYYDDRCQRSNAVLALIFLFIHQYVTHSFID